MSYDTQLVSVARDSNNAEPAAVAVPHITLGYDAALTDAEPASTTDTATSSLQRSLDDVRAACFWNLATIGAFIQHLLCMCVNDYRSGNHTR
jgi:hypothetical protein